MVIGLINKVSMKAKIVQKEMYREFSSNTIRFRLINVYDHLTIDLFKHSAWVQESQDILNEAAVEKNISRKENDTVKKMEMDLDAALTDMVPLTKVTVAVWCEF